MQPLRCPELSICTLLSGLHTYIVIYLHDNTVPIYDAMTSTLCITNHNHHMRITHLNDAHCTNRNDIFQMKLKRQYCTERYYVIQTFARSETSVVCYDMMLSSTKQSTTTPFTLLFHFHIAIHTMAQAHTDCAFHFLRSYVRSFVTYVVLRVTVIAHILMCLLQLLFLFGSIKENKRRHRRCRRGDNDDKSVQNKKKNTTAAYVIACFCIMSAQNIMPFVNLNEFTVFECVCVPYKFVACLTHA